jgi:hypothetical protein
MYKRVLTGGRHKRRGGRSGEIERERERERERETELVQYCKVVLYL